MSKLRELIDWRYGELKILVHDGEIAQVELTKRARHRHEVEGL